MGMPSVPTDAQISEDSRNWSDLSGKTGSRFRLTFL